MAEPMKINIWPKLSFLFVCLLLVSRVKPCLTKGQEYGDPLDTSQVFDEEGYLIANYKAGMVAQRITMCEVQRGGATYLSGIQIDLVDRSSGDKLTGAQLAHTDDTCKNWVPISTTVGLTLGKRKHYSDPSKDVINYAEFRDDTNFVKIEFGNRLESNAGILNYDFDKIDGGFIGVYGSQTDDLISSLGPYSNPGICSCADTRIVSTPIETMVASVTTGLASKQVIPIFPDIYSQQGRGSCGGQTYSIFQTDGSSCDSFLQISNDELVLISSDPAKLGQYEITITVVMEDYPDKTTTSQFTVYLLQLKSGPSYVSSKSLMRLFGPYTTSNTCVSEPNFGFVLSKTMVTQEQTLPAFVTYDATSVAISANPILKNTVGNSFSVTYSCQLDDWVSQVAPYTESVNFIVIENDQCPNLDNPLCPICPDPSDTTDFTCICPDPTDTTDLSCPQEPDCPDINNPDCPICPDPTDTTDPTCPTEPNCPDVNNPDCPICPDPTDTTDPTCPTEPDCPDINNPDCPICPDPTDTSDLTCPVAPNCPDINNPACPICPDPTDTSDPTCPTEPSCPDINNPACPICPDPTDTSDPTCPKTPEPEPEPEPETEPETEPEPEPEPEPETLPEPIVDDHPQFYDLTNHKYYIPSGAGPILEDFFGYPGTYRNAFILESVDQTFSWTYSYRNVDPVDDAFKKYWGDAEIDIDVRLECGQVSFFVDCSIDKNDRVIYISSNGLIDPDLLGWTFLLEVSLVNEIEQQKTFTIEIATLSPLDEEDWELKGDDSTDIVIEGLPNIEAIEIEYAKVDIKGLLTIAFSKYVTKDQTDTYNSSQRRLQDQSSELQLLLTIDETKNGLDQDLTQFSYEIRSFTEKTVEIQLDFECPLCISSFETDVMTIKGRAGDKQLFIQDVNLPPQVTRDHWLVEIIEFGAFVTVCIMGGSIVLSFIFDLLCLRRFKYHALWQTVEVWQQVCYVHLLGVPLPAYSLLYIPELMPAVNFDVFHFLEKYWREIPIVDYVRNEHLLGINFVTFGFDSVHFIQNTRSALGLTLALLVVLSFLSWKLGQKSSRQYMSASILVMLKSMVYMVLCISATIQLRFNGDDGMQTALAILTLCFLALVLPLYFFIKAFRSNTFPTRQNLTLILRALTCVAINWGTEYPVYQFIFLEAIHVLFVVCISHRFTQFQTARSLGLQCSYGLLPTLIFSLRFDESGICAVVLSALILISVTAMHLLYRDWIYRFYLRKVKKENMIAYKAALAKKLKSRKIKQSDKEENNVSLGDSEESEDADDKQLGETEILDFRAPQVDKPVDSKLAILPFMKSNKIMPIMEVPSSDSDHSSNRFKQHVMVPDRQFSMRSQDSYGFQPRESALLRTTGGAHLNQLTTEADDKLKSADQRQERKLIEDQDDQHGFRSSFKISAIDFLNGEEKKGNGEMISFNDSLNSSVKGMRRSNFNEDLLASSSGSQQNANAAKEYTLKQSKRQRAPPSTGAGLIQDLQKDLEISIDIEWPAEQIEAEYRKQQAQKMQLLFGPNWEYKGDAFDIDKTKKELYKWKRSQEKQRSMAFAQVPNVLDFAANEPQFEQKKGAYVINENDRQKSPTGSLMKDSMLQSILRMDQYQSMPANDSMSKNDPLDRMARHKRIASASLDFYLSNPDSMPAEAKKRFKRDGQLDKQMDAREIQLFSRNKKQRGNKITDF